MRPEDEGDLWRWWEEQRAPGLDDLYGRHEGNGSAVLLGVLLLVLLVVM